MQIRDRIKEFRRVSAGELRPHPRNWRTHPPAQQAALRGVLAEIGFADALLVRELTDGSLQLLDGHLRAELTPDAVVPVLVLDVNDEEALKLLATLDPLAALAGADAELLRGLVDEVDTENEAVRAMLDALVEEHAIETDAEPETPDMVVSGCLQVVVECQDEVEQRQIYERLTAEGHKCRVLAL